jgi:hypothetical protein
MRFSVALQFGVALVRSGTAWVVAGEAALGVPMAALEMGWERIRDFVTYG